VIKEQEDGNTIPVIEETPLMAIAISPTASDKAAIVSLKVPVIGRRRHREEMPRINWRQVIGHRSLHARIRAIS
jgi:hypothetical protein